MVVSPAALTSPDYLWLYFYKDFLVVYDSRLRKDAGAYYTPVEVVRTQVRLIDDLLVGRLGKPLGFADPDVVTLDSALGTGTYLLDVIEVRWDDGSGRLTMESAKTDAEARTAYLTPASVEALTAILPEGANGESSVFGLSAASISRRIRAAVARLGQGFSGHSGRVGMARYGHGQCADA